MSYEDESATGCLEGHQMASSDSLPDVTTALIAPAVDATPVGSSSPGGTTVLRRRWYIVFVFSVLAFFIAELLLTWLVIAQSCVAVFDWTAAQVALMQGLVFGSVIIAEFPIVWWIDCKGLRGPVVFSAGLLLLGCALRCVSDTPPLVTWCACVSQVAIGLASCCALTAGPILSEAWFPANQRTTATAIGTIAGYLGVAGAFLFGPCLVQQPKIETMTDRFGSQRINITNISEMKEEIMNVRYAECAVCVVIFAALVVYFPSRPDFAPSISATSKKLDFTAGVRSIFSREKSNFWFACLPTALSVGIYYICVSLYNVSLKPLGITESEAGWLGFVVISVGCISAVFVGRISDLFTGHMKTIALLMQTGLILSTFIFLLIIEGYITYSKSLLYVVCVLQGVFANATVPLCLELAIEDIFPTSEAATTAVISFSFAVLTIPFTLVFLIPNIGTAWMNWVMYGSFLVSFPLLLLFRERYNRLRIDTPHNGYKQRDDHLTA